MPADCVFAAKLRQQHRGVLRRLQSVLADQRKRTARNLATVNAEPAISLIELLRTYCYVGIPDMNARATQIGTYHVELRGLNGVLPLTYRRH